MDVLPTCKSVYHLHTVPARGQKSASDPLELDLTDEIIATSVLGIEPKTSEKTTIFNY